MFFIALFLLELVFLLVLSKSLTNHLAHFIFRLTKSRNFAINFLAILFLPGTILHELAHLLTAGVLMVPAGELTAVPKIEEKGVQLGSVQIGHTDPIRRMLIGVAPLFAGVAAILWILYFTQSHFNLFSFSWISILVFYLIFSIGNSMFSSKKDMEGAIGAGVIILVLILIGSLLAIFFNLNLQALVATVLNWINSSGVVNFFKLASGYMAVPLLIDGILFGLVFSLKK